MTILEFELQNKKEKLAKIFISKKVNLFNRFYNDVTPSTLAQIFSTLHCAFNHLFGSLNNSGNHFHAGPSRQLLNLIDFFEELQGTLCSTDFDFNLNEYYTDIIKKGKGFLKTTGGSTIPRDFFEITLIDEEPIFLLNSIIDLKVKDQTITPIPKKKIGNGSFADVFSFTDPNFGIKMAQKIAFKQSDTKEITRFKTEYKNLKSLDSPFIVKAYTYNENNNSYTMEYIDETLDKYISKRNTKITLSERRTLIVQLLKAFNYIHSKDLLHRDISYTNILVKTYDDSCPIIKVADLGLVKEKDSRLTSDDSSIKGSLNDHSDLELVGYNNYRMVHETFVLTKIVYFILKGRKKFDNESNSYLKDFLNKGLSSNKDGYVL